MSAPNRDEHRRQAATHLAGGDVERAARDAIRRDEPHHAAARQATDEEAVALRRRELLDQLRVRNEASKARAAQRRAERGDHDATA